MSPEILERVISLERSRSIHRCFFNSIRLFFPIRESIKRFPLEAECSFLYNLKYVFIFELKSWLANRGEGAVSVDKSRYSNSFQSKTTRLNFSKKFWVHGFIVSDLRWLRFWSNFFFLFFFLFYMGIFGGRYYQKFQLILLICRLLNSQISNATRSNSSDKVSIEILSSTLGFFVIVICWMFDQSFVEPHSRKI